MIFFCPAKLNLHLDIGPLTSNGFHPISSIFIMVDLYDVLEIEAGPEGSGITVYGNRAVMPANEIITVAAQAYESILGRKIDVSIKVTKRIPIGAGLGGGSSDAATTLLALNQIYGRKLPPSKIREIAMGVGSDVPFFLQGPAAVVTGRGEKTDFFHPPTTWWAMLIDPGFAVSTADAFGWLDLDSQNQVEWSPDPDIKQRFLSLPPAGWDYGNSFSGPLFKRYPVLAQVLDSIHGASIKGISGSGSVCFALFDSYTRAAKATVALSGLRFWLKETLASSPSGVLK